MNTEKEIKKEKFKRVMRYSAAAGWVCLCIFAGWLHWIALVLLLAATCFLFSYAAGECAKEEDKKPSDSEAKK